MRFAKLYELVCEEKSPLKQHALIWRLQEEKPSAKSLWFLAKDIRNNPGDYVTGPDALNFAFIIKRHKEHKSKKELQKFESNDYLHPFISADNPDDIIYYNFWLDGMPVKFNIALLKRLLTAQPDYGDDPAVLRSIHKMNAEEIVDLMKNRIWQSTFNNSTISNYLLNTGTRKEEARFRDKMNDIGNEDWKTVFSQYAITVPTIYRCLVESIYKTPVHPEQMDSKLHGLPYNLAKDLYRRGKNPKKMAAENCNVDFTVNYGDDPSYNYEEDFAKYGPTKSEAYEWLIECAKNNSPVNYTRWKLGLNPHTRQDWRTSTAYSLEFPSYKVFRWFDKNKMSTYFKKEITLHGPQNTTIKFLPLDHIINLRNSDFGTANDLKISPEKVFTRLQDRIIHKYNELAKDKFNIKNTYKKIPGVNVIDNMGSLEYERDRMKHCVKTYAKSASLGEIILLSLPNSTAELHPDTLKVYQHKGAENADPPKTDYYLLDKWIDAQKTN